MMNDDEEQFYGMVNVVRADAHTAVKAVMVQGNVPSNWVPERHYRFFVRETDRGEEGFLRDRERWDYVLLRRYQVGQRGGVSPTWMLDDEVRRLQSNESPRQMQKRSDFTSDMYLAQELEEQYKTPFAWDNYYATVDETLSDKLSELDFEAYASMLQVGERDKTGEDPGELRLRLQRLKVSGRRLRRSV